MKPLYAILLASLLIGVLLGCVAIGTMLARIERAQHTAAAARAEVRLLRAQMDQRKAHVPAAFDARPSLQLLGVRTEVLRRTIETLILSGTRWPADFRGFPQLQEAAWPAWPERGWDLRVEPMRVAGGEPR